MKKIYLMAAAIIMLMSSAFKVSATVVPPLKADIAVDTVAWTPYSLPEVFLGMADGDDAEEGVDDRMMNIASEIADYAAQFIGRRYRLGSTGPKTFDCSGFMSYIFRKAGIELNRTSRMQYAQGESVDRSEIRPGDLMFFSSPRSGRGRVGHVAMVVDVDSESGSCTFIHASSSKGVSYQTFPDGGYFSRNYIGAKRVIS